ncbi:DNA pilot protein [Microvirus sp.]|nr:DNA pilot protein [Microvirus sp.]
MPNITDPVTLSPGAALGSAAISGGAGLIGSGLQYLFNKKLAEKQNEYNLNMWKMQAEYNSPQAQMERYRAAGLNPNLIYGQGNNGNMSNAPQMVTPNAPHIDKEMQRLGELFNIENLRTLTANRKKAQADAQTAQTNANRNQLEFVGDILFGQKYGFNPTTGKYEIRPEYYKGGKNVYSMYSYVLDDRLRNAMRASLIRSQMDYLAPQISMLNYEGQNKKFSYWLDKAGKIIQNVGTGLGWLNPRNWFMPLNGMRGHYIDPRGRVFNY